MSDEPFAPEPASPSRTPYVIGGVAFLSGIALTAAAYQFGPVRTAAPVPPVATGDPAAQVPAPALPPGTDIATLNARETALAGRLDQLELRLRDVDGSARNASGYASRAEQLLLATSVRRAIERKTPLGPLEPQLRARFGEGHPEAVAAITRAAADPMGLQDLREALDRIAPRLVSGSSDSLWTRARRMIGDLVVLRQAGTPSPRTADRLVRARAALDRGQVEAALAEVVHMPGAGDAQSWTTAASRFAATQNALDEIERAAIAALPPVAAPTQAAGR